MSTSSDGVRVIRSATGNTLIDIADENDVGRSVAVQADGKIWVGGFTHNFGEFYQYAVVRLNPNGTLDTAFGDGGKQVIADRVMLGDEYSLAVQGDGRLLVTHASASGSSIGLAVSRYTVDGSLDATFGTAGVANLDADVSYADTGTTVLDDGKVLVSGRNDDIYTVARLNADGSPDTTFNGTGILHFIGPENGFANYDFPMTQQADGKLLLPGVETDRFGLYRYKPDGSLDTTFGTQGHVSYSVGSGADGAYTVTVQPDGKLLLAGSSDTGDFNVDYSIVRLNADGSLDTTFSGNGKAAFELGSGDDRARSVALQDDGKIVLVGSTDGDFGVVRLNADGSLDHSFGTLVKGFETLLGTSGDDVIIGGEVREKIFAYAGNDLIEGGGGRETILTGTGADVIRYTSVSDSYRTATASHSDLINDFVSREDRLDVSALGFTGLGNGHGGTLAVQVSGDGSRTYLKSFDADAEGQRFEVTLNGNHADLAAADVIFSHADTGALELLGTAPAEHLG